MTSLADSFATVRIPQPFERAGEAATQRAKQPRPALDPNVDAALSLEQHPDCTGRVSSQERLAP